MVCQTMPVLFVAHGAPTLAIDSQQAADFIRWGKTLPKPTAILVFSAHWEGAELSFGETHQHDQLIYDFGGFPDELYQLQYMAPGAPFLIERIKPLLAPQFSPIEGKRGLDHGVWVPLLHLWPNADVPVLQMSMPSTFSNTQLFQLGQRLQSLRRSGVIIVGSGVLTHNLRRIIPNHRGMPLDWAAEFDHWVETTLNNKDMDALLQWQTKAPHAAMNHPSPEHFRPLLIVAGAAGDDSPQYPVSGFEWGSLSRRSIQYS